jgi:alcohol dehydrogenase (cytochrome c)
MIVLPVENFFRMLVLSLFLGVGFQPLATAADITPAPAFSTSDLIAHPRTDWITNGGNLYHQRYSPLIQLNPDNVAGLKAVWRAGLNSGLGPSHNNQAQPLVYAGVLYIITGADDVFAIDIKSGNILWSYTANLDPKDVLVCCGWVSRGVGMGEGKIFVGQLDAKLIALDQRTGKVIWSTQIENPRKGYSITAAPLYYDGMVIVGNAGGDMGTRGRMQAYDAKDGSLIWTFYTIPGPGEFGHDTWPQDNDSWQYGGAPVWHTPTVDPELGMIYFGAGNPAPDLGGMVRPGDNLFSDSIVALDVRTGAYRWHFQEVHHDIWDYDIANPIILFDAEYDGIKRKGLAQAGKTGWVYLLDRETGEPLIGIEERPVQQEPRQATAATQPYPIGDALVPQHIDIVPEGFELVNEGRIFTPFFDKTGIYKPMAAVNWPPSSYDPETNLMYICATDVASGASADDSQYAGPTFERHFFGGRWNHPDIARRGIFTALDVRTNRIAWQRQWAERCRSGSLVTAGGLVFVGRNDGRLTALDKSTGDTLWEFRTDAGINTSVTAFEHQGEQYIATYAGGASMDGGARGDGVWLFSLRGTLNPLPPLPSRFNPARAIPVPEGRAANLENGRTIFMQSCQYCHGAAGEGGQGGGMQLTTTKLSLQELMNVLGAGRNAMPAFSTMLSADDIHDAASYILEQLLND